MASLFHVFPHGVWNLLWTLLSSRLSVSLGHDFLHPPGLADLSMLSLRGLLNLVVALFSKTSTE